MLFLLCVWGQFSNFKPPRGLYTWRGLFSEFYGIRYVVKNNSRHPSRGPGASQSNFDFEIFKLALNLFLTHYSVSNEPARKLFLPKPIQLPLIYGNHCNCYFWDIFLKRNCFCVYRESITRPTFSKGLFFCLNYLLQCMPILRIGLRYISIKFAFNLFTH